MERLTKWLNDKTAICIKECEKECVEGYTECHKCNPFKDVMNKLVEYEDAEEQGLLLRLKLKVGDEFWELNDNFVEPAIYPRKAHSLQHVLYCMDNLGKTTFLTYEEAELELANRQQSHAEAIMDERNGR